MTAHHSGRRRRAFTLAEALLATTILAIIAATATLPFSAGIQNAVEAQKLEQGVELGEALMEEIIARPFYSTKQTGPTPGPESGEDSRLAYDSIDDFDGYSEQSTGLRTFKGKPLNDADTAEFWRSCSVKFVTYAGMQPGDVNSVAHAQVTVYWKKNALVTIDRLICREN